MTRKICLKKTYCVLVQHKYGEKTSMKKKPVVASTAAKTKKTRNPKNKKAELGIRRIVTGEGYSKKVVANILEWYEK